MRQGSFWLAYGILAEGVAGRGCSWPPGGAARPNELWPGDALHGPRIAGRKAYLRDRERQGPGSGGRPRPRRARRLKRTTRKAAMLRHRPRCAPPGPHQLRHDLPRVRDFAI